MKRPQGAAGRTGGHVKRALPTWPGKSEDLRWVVAGSGKVVELVWGSWLVFFCEDSRFVNAIVAVVPPGL